MHRLDGQPIRQKDAIIYLGSSISLEGNADAEVARRFGMSQSGFNSLSKVWRHSRVSRGDRYRIYQACVLSKLLYGLQTTWLNKASLRKLDGFHARCVRKIAGIAPSYWSRVSNLHVLQSVGALKLSDMIREQQLNFFGKLARRSDDCPVRQLVFNHDLSMKAFDVKRRQGQPVFEWAKELFKVVNGMFASLSDFRACIADRARWHACIRHLCRNNPG